MQIEELVLVTIVTEAAVEDRLERDVTSAGSHGRTVCDARSRGVRADEFEGANIRMETLVSLRWRRESSTTSTATTPLHGESSSTPARACARPGIRDPAGAGAWAARPGATHPGALSRAYPTASEVARLTQTR